MDSTSENLNSHQKELSPLKRAIPQIIAVSVKNVFLLEFGSTVGFPTILIGSLSGGNTEEPISMSQEAISWIGTYAAEITESSLRGALNSTTIMSINLGVLIAFILGTFLNWRTMALINACILLVAFILLMFVPESPYWLISQNMLDEAKKSLAWLRGWTSESNIEEEYLKICDNLQKHPMTTHNTMKFFALDKIKLYLKPSFLKPLFLINLIFIMEHIGNTPFTVYAIKIFNLLEVPIGPYSATIYIGIVQLLAVITCVFAIKYLGKRILVSISLIGVFIGFVVTGTYSYVAEDNYFNATNLNNISYSYNWVPLVTLIGQAFFTYLCIKGLPWILIGELFNNDVRGFGSRFSATTGYVSGFICNKTFLNTVAFATLPGVWWFYSAVTFFGLISLNFLLPETEGKSLVEIIEHYSGGKKLDNKVHRGEVRFGDKINEEQKHNLVNDE